MSSGLSVPHVSVGGVIAAVVSAVGGWLAAFYQANKPK